MSWDAAQVVVIGGRGGVGAQLHAQLEQDGATVHCLDLDSGFDATDPEQCSAFFAEHPEVETVFYAAGIAISGELTAPRGHDDFTCAVKTNVGGLINIARSSAEALRRNRGRLVALDSAFSQVTAHGYGAYSASKAALNMTCEGLRPELAPATVTTCMLGGVDTGIFATAAQRSGTTAAQEVSRRFTRRIARATPEQAARNILKAARNRRRNPKIGADARAIAALMHISPTLTRRLIMQAIGPYPETA